MNERELVEQSKKGDEDAFSALIGTYQPRVFRHCLKVVHDEEIAQDLTQETFLHAYHHLGTFRMEASFYTWLYRIAHNLSLNYLKKKGAHPETEFKEEMSSGVVVKEEEELDPRIQEAVQTLAPKHRVVFELYDLQRVPQKEIAAQLDISHGTVRSRLYYARRKIREYIKQLPREA